MKRDYNWWMDLTRLPPEGEARILKALAEHQREAPPRRPRQKWKTAVAAAAAAALMTGAAFAAAYQAGVLDLFFHGDTGSLEPYVQMTIPSTENEDYRLTVDSSLYDGQNLYLVMTVEALNEQAVSDLERQRIASPHTICWDLSSLSSPDPSGAAQITAHSMGVKELPAQTDASRTWQIDLNFDGFIGRKDSPVLLWLDFMGPETAVSIPLDTILEPIHLTPNEPVTIDTITGQQAILKEFTLSATSYSLELQVEGLPEHARPQTYSVPLFLRMKDGTVLTRAQLLSPSGGQQFRTVLDLSQVASVIYGYTEFPTDGSAPFPAHLDPHLYPFKTEILPEPFHGTARSYIADAASLCRGLGADFSWDLVSRSLSAVYRGTTLELTAGSVTALINGVPSVMETVQYDPSGQAVSVPLPACENGNTLSAIDQIFLDAWDLDACMEYAYQSELELPAGEHLIIIP